MTQQPIATRTVLVASGTRGAFVAQAAVRMVGALLAIAIAAVHVADQGSLAALSSPAWIGWGYRLIEAGGVLTAAVLLVAPPVILRIGWAAAALLATGPFVGYLASRTVGVPGDPHDVGNWGYWVGTVSLVVETALIVLSIGMLVALRLHTSPERSRRSW